MWPGHMRLWAVVYNKSKNCFLGLEKAESSVILTLLFLCEQELHPDFSGPSLYHLSLLASAGGRFCLDILSFLASAQIYYCYISHLELLRSFHLNCLSCIPWMYLFYFHQCLEIQLPSTSFLIAVFEASFSCTPQTSDCDYSRSIDEAGPEDVVITLSGSIDVHFLCS